MCQICPLRAQVGLQIVDDVAKIRILLQDPETVAAINMKPCADETIPDACKAAGWKVEDWNHLKNFTVAGLALLLQQINWESVTLLMAHGIDIHQPGFLGEPIANQNWTNRGNVIDVVKTAFPAERHAKLVQLYKERLILAATENTALGVKQWMIAEQKNDVNAVASTGLTAYQTAEQKKHHTIQVYLIAYKAKFTHDGVTTILDEKTEQKAIDFFVTLADAACKQSTNQPAHQALIQAALVQHLNLILQKASPLIKNLAGVVFYSLKDYKNAEQCYRAAENEYPFCKYNLAHLYQYGYHLQKSPSLAVEYYMQAYSEFKKATTRATINIGGHSYLVVDRIILHLNRIATPILNGSAATAQLPTDNKDMKFNSPLAADQKSAAPAVIPEADDKGPLTAAKCLVEIYLERFEIDKAAAVFVKIPANEKQASHVKFFAALQTVDVIERIELLRDIAKTLTDEITKAAAKQQLTTLATHSDTTIQNFAKVALVLLDPSKSDLSSIQDTQLLPLWHNFFRAMFCLKGRGLGKFPDPIYAAFLFKQIAAQGLLLASVWQAKCYIALNEDHLITKAHAIAAETITAAANVKYVAVDKGYILNQCRQLQSAQKTDAKSELALRSSVKAIAASPEETALIANIKKYETSSPESPTFKLYIDNLNVLGSLLHTRYQQSDDSSVFTANFDVFKNAAERGYFKVDIGYWYAVGLSNESLRPDIPNAIKHYQLFLHHSEFNFNTSRLVYLFALADVTATPLNVINEFERLRKSIDKISLQACEKFATFCAELSEIFMLDVHFRDQCQQYAILYYSYAWQLGSEFAVKKLEQYADTRSTTTLSKELRKNSQKMAQLQAQEFLYRGGAEAELAKVFIAKLILTKVVLPTTDAKTQVATGDHKDTATAAAATTATVAILDTIPEDNIYAVTAMAFDEKKAGWMPARFALAVMLKDEKNHIYLIESNSIQATVGDKKTWLKFANESLATLKSKGYQPAIRFLQKEQRAKIVDAKSATVVVDAGAVAVPAKPPRVGMIATPGQSAQSLFGSGSVSGTATTAPTAGSAGANSQLAPLSIEAAKL